MYIIIYIYYLFIRLYATRMDLIFSACLPQSHAAVLPSEWGSPFSGRGRRAPGLSVAPKERKKGAPSNLEVSYILPSLNKPLSDLRRAVCSGHAPTIMGFGLSWVRSDVVNNPRLHSRGPSFGGQVGPDYSNPLRRNHPARRGTRVTTCQAIPRSLINTYKMLRRPSL